MAQKCLKRIISEIFSGTFNSVEKFPDNCSEKKYHIIYYIKF